MLNMQDYSDLGKRVLCILGGIGDVRQESRSKVSHDFWAGFVRSRGFACNPLLGMSPKNIMELGFIFYPPQERSQLGKVSGPPAANLTSAAGSVVMKWTARTGRGEVDDTPVSFLLKTFPHSATTCASHN